ncbi:MAG: hypothetical protein M1817_003020 [Caeruleum heppii]|nr:MAG: hypothetical protein M1817_003020 [Caeruleum heppii]
MTSRRRNPPTASSSSSTTTTSETLSSLSSTVEEKIKSTTLLLWDDLPPWRRDNHYIHTGYRHTSSSILTSLHSLLYLHNESLNIYTHLFGTLFFTLLSHVLYNTLGGRRYATATTGDLWAFAAFFLGAGFCLGVSAMYHALSNHSLKVARWGNQLDYVGIVGLIVGSFGGSVYYGFFCEGGVRGLYWGMISLLGLSCTLVSIIPTFRTPQWRPYRAAMFVGMGLSAVIPVIHGLFLWDPSQLDRQIGLRWLLLEGFLYILGAGIYAARVPEKWAPGRFDIWGSSHQIFHVLVVAAAGAHLRGLVAAFDHRHGVEGGKCA